MLKQFTDWLADNLSLTIGTTVFAGFIPNDAADSCSVVVDWSPGDEHATGWIAKPLQLVSRALDYFEAEAEAKRIADFAINKCGVSLESWTLYSITGQAPYYVGADSLGRHQFVTNLVVRMREE